jgi:hypothetical protein
MAARLQESSFVTGSGESVLLEIEDACYGGDLLAILL